MTPKNRDELRELIARADFDSLYKGDSVWWEDLAPAARGRWYKSADAILAALDEAGLAVVPREPTENMGVNGYEVIDWSDGPHSRAYAYNRVSTIYRAMLAASPYEEE